MKIYVAGKFEEKPLIRETQRKLITLGHVIVGDWTTYDDTGKTGDELEAYWTVSALADLQGVRACDLLFLVTHKNGRGSMTELGIAIAERKLIVVCNYEECVNVFFYLPSVKRMKTIDEGVALVQKLAET